MASLADELHFINEHPLWSGVSFQPLLRALKWNASNIVLLMVSLLTDQRVLLHTTRRELLYPAAAALKSLIAPLRSAGIFIPFLPGSLLSQVEADTLVNEATQPYIIGVYMYLCICIHIYIYIYIFNREMLYAHVYTYYIFHKKLHT